MSRQKVEKVMKLLVQLGEYANFPLDEVDDDDTILLRDLALEYVKLVSRILAGNCKTVDDNCCNDAKAAFHTLTRMNLKYALRRIDKTWNLYRYYDSSIKTFFDMSDHSDAHGEASNILCNSRSRDRTAKIMNYDEFIPHIKRMNELSEKIRKTHSDCLAKIREDKISNWLKRHGAWIGVITLLITVCICTNTSTLRHSIVGQFMAKCSSIILQCFSSNEPRMGTHTESKEFSSESNSSNRGNVPNTIK